MFGKRKWMVWLMFRRTWNKKSEHIRSKLYASCLGLFKKLATPAFGSWYDLETKTHYTDVSNCSEQKIRQYLDVKKQ